ncbi:methionyl-tRNA formyltransferase [Pseudorhodobacter antarcticus]|uniref:Methionyl-tRNA formyltransferase n=1 Tax=Pseudorhodobacter antarcticus TaxID=1077947 RepID=A0A1H8ABB6_9RHOB|nr:methionyl-tRNA formyltransferase [Pseudorhodobacter antarcticus]SEM66847.1 methionyl-tRNA formyltransferase [Pseudorhodobacter antarcticus]
MRVIFMGTPDFSVPILQALVQKHEVVAVYSQPPRPAGRGKKDRPSAVQTCAEGSGLPVHTPVSLRSEDAAKTFASHRADIAVVVAYGLILPQNILDTPPNGCLNIHASLLPRWRGAAPIHRAIMTGDAASGVCIMQMEAGLDTGPVLLRSETTIEAEDTTADLHDRLSSMGAALIVQALDNLPRLVPTPQPIDGVTYALKIDKVESRINWSQPAETVDRVIRGLSPFPGAWCDVAGERVKLLRSRVTQGTGAPGQVLDGFTIACGTRAIEVLQAQREGKRPATTNDILRGFTLPDRLT